MNTKEMWDVFPGPHTFRSSTVTRFPAGFFLVSTPTSSASQRSASVIEAVAGKQKKDS